MKILQNKFIINHKNSRNNSNYKNNCKLSVIFYITTNTATSAVVTAAIMIFMHAIVSVNTTKTGGHIRPDTEITKTIAETWTKTWFDLSKNPVIAQQSTKTQTLPTTSSSSQSAVATAASAFSTLNSFHMSHQAAATIRQPKAINAKTSATAITTTNTSLGDCKSLTGAWGDVDPNIFYICDTQTKKPLQLRCPEGKGFFLGLGYSGCIPFDQWPACISSGHLEQVVVCDSKHMQQPWECMNPNKFYVCLKESIEPTILNCETGKGFVHAIVTTTTTNAGSGTRESGTTGTSTTSEIVGCANWEKWRNYMQCNDYY
ncbi:hypothetical protein FF38_02762 [Lucilia cuprina]|uniref:Chitin-binding type-2 domain-containing protein n=1 Tax=Lucilia cuprina TaxID=7375 RepID=A0A0L0CSV0_LUCCU|nr:hypothetical protein CVS40_0726 [Lucilia cuprina]KNC34479.1 hypothetical protein FF38_02762 [Lucilia cuprina]